MADIITIDIGNSNIVIGLWKDSSLCGPWRIATRRDYSSLDIKAAIENIFAKIKLSQTTGAIISSVVPEITMAASEAIECFIHEKPLIMGPFLHTGIDISDYDGPKLGVDRIVDLTAARSLFIPSDEKEKIKGEKARSIPVMVCDLGTCTTITVADAYGKVAGGMICAGVQLSLDAQAMRASQLPKLKAEKVYNLLGQDTASNMLSGAVAGCGIMITGIYEQLSGDHLKDRELFDESPREVNNLSDIRLVITGGLGEIVMPWIKAGAVYEPNLLLKGLREIYILNK
ncbi:MAG: type III pantothenate kinase [Butyrivibrio sp.]|nr:type III pantothenate kinase [Butyrivibrio sp.]